MNYIYYLFIFLSTLCFAGNKTGNGGFIAECITTGETPLPRMEVLDILEKYPNNGRFSYLNMLNSSDENMQVLLLRIRKSDPLLAQSLISIYTEFKNNFSLVDNLDEFNIKDINKSIATYSHQCWIRLAVVQLQEGESVKYYANKRIWNRLTDTQKAYLILHEVYYTYVLINSKFISNSDTVRDFVYNLASGQN